MLSNRKALMVASLALAVLATSAVVSPAPIQAGPISDMLAKHRQARQMKLPPVTKPHTIVPFKDPNARTASLSQRFKQRFSLKRGAADGATKDQGVIKTSR
jgi:hypothetical protein